jgi:transposase
MVSEGIVPLKSGSGVVRYKFVCPKMKLITVNGKNKRKHFCDNPCTDSFSGRMIYVYPEKDLRTYPGTLRDTDQWVKTYKLRSVVEKSINHFKEDSFCLANRKTQNEKTTHADLLLAGLTQLITVILADKFHQYQFIRSLKPLIA